MFMSWPLFTGPMLIFVGVKTVGERGTDYYYRESILHFLTKSGLFKTEHNCSNKEEW